MKPMKQCFGSAQVFMRIWFRIWDPENVYTDPGSGTQKQCCSAGWLIRTVDWEDELAVTAGEEEKPTAGKGVERPVAQGFRSQGGSRLLKIPTATPEIIVQSALRITLKRIQIRKSSY